jgi:uncharacterized protein YdeI (YjbR/CyaY-like superfamily)
MKLSNPETDWFFEKDTPWKESYEALRKIVMDGNAALKEELKWGCPCYTFNNNNVLLIHGFKNYCALLFHKGVLLKDKHNLLIKQTKNVQSARQMRFNSVDEIIESKKIIIDYIEDAIKIEKAGLKVELKKVFDYEMPVEFESALKEMPELKTAFEQLTPGRQKAYLLYFSSAKQIKTRESRIEKYIPTILAGEGLDD